MKKKLLFCLMFLASFALAIHADDAPTVYTIDQIKTKIANKEKVEGLLVKGVIGTYTLNKKKQYKIGDCMIWNAVKIPNRDKVLKVGEEVTLKIISIDFYEEGSQEHTFYKTQYVGDFKLPEGEEDPMVYEDSPCNRYYQSAVKFIVDTPVIHPFTVNEKTEAKVIFSSGNLQYCPAKDEWRFALRQFDRVGNGMSVYAPEGLQSSGVNGNITTVFYDSIDYSTTDNNTASGFKVIKVPCNNLLGAKSYQGWIDVFPWATSGHGRKVGDKYTTFFFPYELNNAEVNATYNQYGYGPSFNGGHGQLATNNHIDKKSGMNRLFDWGYRNYIREYMGCEFDAQNQFVQAADSTMYLLNRWRTLRKDEWTHLLTKRIVDGNDSAFTYVRLQYTNNASDTVTGILIYPDDFSFSEAGVARLPFGAYSVTKINAAMWEALEEVGVVFIPCVQQLYLQNGVPTINNQQYGLNCAYWTASAFDASKAHDILFNISGRKLTADNSDPRSTAYPVRLVQDYYDPCNLVMVEYKDTLVEVRSADVTFKWEYAGKTREVSTAQKEYYDTLYTSELGCDSVIYHLIFDYICKSITQSKDTTVQLALTERSFTWEIDGQSFKHTISTSKTSEEFKDTLRTEQGCDSIFYTLTLHYPEFTVANGKKVTFSPGNLQYKATSSTSISWRFGPTQYDRRMADNASPSATANKWMDLFGWGTSGISPGKKPYETSSTPTDYSWSEWGDNKIGDYAAKTWRTPKKDEWNYLFSTRKVNGADGYSYVRLKTGSNTRDTVTGCLIYPDNFTWAKAGVTAIATGASAGVKAVDNATWKALEKAGCAFLPGCSYRDGTTVNADYYGRNTFYWSATQYSNSAAYLANFNFLGRSILPENYANRYGGYAVRLVREVK